MILGIILPYLKSRGTELQALRVAQGLIKNNFNVVLFVIQGWGDQKVYDLFEKSGVKVVNVGKPNNIGEKKVSIIRIFSLVKLIYINKCDLILNRATLTARISGYAGRILFVPVISVLSGRIVSSIAKNKYLSIARAVHKFISLGCPSKIISVSKEGSKNFKKSFPLLSSRVFSIQNGVHLPDFCFENYKLKKNKSFIFCFSGSLDLDRKGIDLLLQALHMMIFNYKVQNILLVLIGSGQDQDEITRISKDLKILNHVKFAGEISEPIYKIINYNTFILSSRREGLPNALLEAMSIGIPCIACDCDTGPREIITNNKNGLLVPANSSKELAISMMKVYENEKLRRLLGNNARKTIKNSFSIDDMIEQYISVLKT